MKVTFFGVEIGEAEKYVCLDDYTRMYEVFVPTEPWDQCLGPAPQLIVNALAGIVQTQNILDSNVTIYNRLTSQDFISCLRMLKTT